MASLTTFQLNKTGLAVLMSYIAGGWTLIEISKHLLERFYVSDIWLDILGFLLLTMSPTIMVLVFVVGRAKFKRFFIPSNIILCVVFGIFSFIGKPLGTYANNINVVNEKENKESHILLNDIYETKIGIGKFINTNEIDSLNWLIYGIRGLTELELEYGDLVSCPTFYTDLSSETSIVNILENSSWDDLDYFLLGSFTSTGNYFNVQCKLYNRSGNSLFQKTFNSDNVYRLIDEIVSAIYDHIEIPNEITLKLDFPLEEISTKSIEALKLYGAAKGQAILADIRYVNLTNSYSQAIFLDSTFSQAYLELGKDHANPIFAYDTYSKGLPYRKSLRERDQLIYLMEYWGVKGDTTKALNLASEIIKNNPKSYSRINEALDLLRMFPGSYQVVKEKSFDLYESLDFQDKLLLFDRGAFLGDTHLLEIIKQEIDSDPLNFELNNRFLYLLYSTEMFAEFRNQIEKMNTLFPEYETSLNKILGCIDNIGVTNINGLYSYNGYYYRKFIRNKKGILFCIYNERHNATTPLFELDEDNFLWFINGNASQTEIIRSNDNVPIYTNTVGTKSLRYYVPSEIQPIINDFIKGIVKEGANIIEQLTEQFPDNLFVTRLRTHVEYLSKGNKFNHEVVGNYFRNIEIVEKNGTLIKDDIKNKRFSSKEYLFPINDSTFMSSSSLNKNLRFTIKNGKKGFEEYFYVTNDSIRSITFTEKILLH